MENTFGLNTMDVNKGSSASCCMAAGSAVSANSTWCDRTDCPSYGKWWCPFTGW